MSKRQMELVCGFVEFAAVGVCFLAAWWAGVAAIVAIVAQLAWVDYRVRTNDLP